MLDKIFRRSAALAVFALVMSAFSFGAAGDLSTNNYATTQKSYAQWVAFTAVATGASMDVSQTAPMSHTVQFVVTGGPATCTLTLEGSIDNGVTWFTLATGTCTSSGSMSFSGRGVNRVRPNLTILTGGASPTITPYYLGLPGGAGTGSTVGTAVGSSGGTPILCDTTASGTVTAGQLQMVRCNTGGVLALVNTFAWTDGASNGTFATMLDSAGSARGLWVAPFVYNGVTADRPRSASITTLPTAVTTTARNEIGHALTEKGSRWSVVSTPAVSTKASASIAAEAAVRHVLDCVSFSGGSTTAPALTQLQIQIRDGATGAGTIIWSHTVIVSAATGQNVAPFTECGLNLVGTTNTAMTAEWSLLLTSLFEDISMSGFNVN